MSNSTSDIERVTLFEDRAEVSRRVSVEKPAGTHRVWVEGLALTVDETSLSAGTKEAGARILGARVHRRTRNLESASAAEIAAIEADGQSARTRRVVAERALGRAQSDEARVAALLAKWSESLSRVPRGGAAEIARWKSSYQSLESSLKKSQEEVATHEAELASAKLDEARASLRLAEGRRLVPRYEAAAELQLEILPAAASRAISIDLSYRTPLALWRPEHVARLVPKDNGYELLIQTLATVWQRTGEQWRDVKCRFSTARPAQAATPPLLNDDEISLRKRQDKVIHVAAREETIQSAGLGRGSRAVEDMPGVEDGGQPLYFDAARAVTIPSDGQPFRVELGERRLACEVDLVVFPEKSEAAHLRATATWTGAGPLLAGPVRLGRAASMVGRGRTTFVGEGEPFELGFGADDGVRVRRRVDEQEDSSLMGTQRRKRSVNLFLSNVSSTARRLLVVERIPVSEIEDVTITPVDLGGAKLDTDGYARFTVELGANETKKLLLVYKIEAAAKVHLNF